MFEFLYLTSNVVTSIRNQRLMHFFEEKVFDCRARLGRLVIVRRTESSFNFTTHCWKNIEHHLDIFISKF